MRHYADASDNPAWSVDTTGGVSTTSRYLALTGDGLGLTVTTTGSATKATLGLAGPRGDVVSSTTLTNSDPAGGIDQWGEYTEYGTPTGTTQPGIGYGWLGQHERATLTSLGITLMGARLYNQATGLFTSIDPQHQGGDTAYGYPNDPINSTDLDGNSWWSRHRGAVLDGVRTAVSVAALVGCTVCGAVATAWTVYSIYRNVRRRNWTGAAAESMSFVPLGGRFAARMRVGHLTRRLSAVRGRQAGVQRRAIRRQLSRAQERYYRARYYGGW